MTKQLHTVDDVIEELGGPEKVVELTGRGNSQSMIPTWRYRKQFPTKTVKTMQAALLERGATAPDSLWGL